MGVMMTPADIRRLRLDLDLTLAKFGAILGVSESTISYWESGKSHPRYAMMLRLSKMFDEVKAKRRAEDAAREAVVA